MKKLLSIILSAALLLGTLTVLTLLPASAEEWVPVNLVYNGEFEGIDTDGDGTVDKHQYTADDAAASTYPGEFMKDRPVGWRVNSDIYSNAKPVYASTLKPEGYITNYAGAQVGVINQGAAMMQDIAFEAGKYYTVSAKMGYSPSTTDTTAQSGWKMIVGLDAKTGIETPSNSNSDYTKFGVVEIWKFSAIEGTNLFGAGDMVDRSFTFSSDEFIAANNLTIGADGKYHARLIIFNYAWGGSFSGLVDEVSMYESLSLGASEGGYIAGDADAKAGEKYTVTAVPYYGNTFLGWYDTNDVLYSSSATISGTLTESLVAKFNVYNQVVDGNFESGTTAGQDFFNAETHTPSGGNNTVIANPVGGNGHGDYVLKATPKAAANTNADLLTIPFTVKKNTRYVMHLSYYSADIDGTAHVGLHSRKSFTNGWTKNTYVNNPTFHWEPEGTTNLAAWTVFGGYGGRYGMMREQTHATVGAGKNKWIDYWVTFETGTEATIFEDGKDTAEMFFLFGVENSTLNTFYVDNVSITEAKATANSAITAVTSGNGTVTAAQFVPDSVCYAANGGTKVGTVSTAVEGSVAHSQVAINTYTATPNSRYEFAGWFDAKGNLVSMNETETFYTEGVYEAKFASSPYATDGGFITKLGESYTAKAYYGNKFVGWYDIDNKLITTSATYAATPGTYAKFEKHNLVDNGDFSEDTVNYYIQNANSSASIKTDADGNKYLRMEATTSAAALDSFQWNFKLKKNRRYVISYKLRSGIDENGNLLSSENAAFRKIFLYHTGNHSYTWSDPLFAYQYAYTGGSNGYFADVPDLLPSGGSDLNPAGKSTSFPGIFVDDLSEWTNYSYILDTSSVTLANGTDITDNIDLGMIFGANGAGTMVLDIDDIVVSEVNNEIEVTQASGGEISIDRLASTATLPVTFTASPEENHVFIGWVDENGHPVSSQNPYTTFDAVSLSAIFAEFDPDSTIFTVNAKVEQQNGIYGGYIVGEKSASGLLGSTFTFTATPYAGNTFMGWYVNGKKVSENATYTGYIVGSNDVVARFNINNLWPDAGYENTIRNTTILSDKALDISPNAYFEWNSYNPSLWWDAKVLTSKPYSGEASLELTHRNNEVLREITGLEKNTDYELSFYWFIRNAFSGGANSAPSYLKSIRFYDKNGKMFSTTTLGTEYSADFQQSKVYFNSGNNTEIYVALTYYAGSSTIVCDDFCLIPGDSDEYVAVHYDSGDNRVGVITEMELKGSTHTVKDPYSKVPAKDFVNWSMGANTYKKNDTIVVTKDITLTANYKDFVSNNLVDSTTFDPDNYDFTFAILPDEQKLLLNYPDYYVDISNWITTNQEKYNIKGVFSMGDLTELGSYNQWFNTRKAFDSIIGKIPFGITLGNHDYANGASTGAYNASAERQTGIFNYFYKQSQFNTLPEWGGAYDDTMDNTYHKINVNGVKIMVISLEIYPRYDVIEWAGKLCEDNPDYKVIVTTHSHLSSDGTRFTEEESPYIFTNPEDSSSPQELYDQLLKVHSNIVMLLCGHDSSSTNKVLTTKGVNGNTIHEVLMDNQADDINYRGLGNVVLMGFYDNGQMVDFTTYSTVQDKYFIPSSNEFTLSLDKEIGVEGYGNATCDKKYVGENLVRIYEAKPYGGNTFRGWYDIDGNLVSKSATYSTTTYTYLKAVFSGHNTIDNGDFENGKIPDILFSSTNRIEVLDYEKPVEGRGNKYLSYSAPSQETLQTGFKLPVKKNTNYTLSFDMNITEFGVNGFLRTGFMYSPAALDNLAVMGGVTQSYLNPTTGYKKTASSEAGEVFRAGDVGYKAYTTYFDSDWLRYTITFNSGSDENVFADGDKGYLYLMLHTLNNRFDMQIDNIVFAGSSAVVAEAEKGGIASANKSAAVPGTEVTFTATPDYGNRFAGWYDLNGKFVSLENTITTDEHLHLIARFSVYNLVEDGGFEHGGIGDWNTTSNAVTIENAAHSGSVDSEFGNRYLKITDNATGYLNFNLPVAVEANTKYLVHFSYKVTSTSNSRTDLTINSVAGWGAFTSLTTYFSGSKSGDSKTGMRDMLYPNNLVNKYGDGWIEVNAIVDTANELKDGKLYIAIGAKADGVFYIDNVSVTPISEIAPTMLGATLISENGKYKEGSISYKSEFGIVPSSMKLTEVGTLAMPTQLFTGELTKDTANVSYARITNTSGINLNSTSYYATFTNTETINPSAKISARSYIVLTDKYGKHNFTFYSENENAAKAIVNGTYNRSVNQVKRLLAVALIENFAGNYPADFFSDEDVTETTNVKSSASVSVEKVWNFVKRNAYLLSGVNNTEAEEVNNLINDGSFENDEFYLGGFKNTVVTDNPYSYTTTDKSYGIVYGYDHNGFIYATRSDYYLAKDADGNQIPFDSYIKLDDFGHTGDHSLRLSTRAGTVSYILRNLKPNTDYEFSFYWYTTSPVHLAKAYIFPHKIMNASYTYLENIVIDGTTYRKYQYNTEEFLAPSQLSIESYALDHTFGPIYADGTWQKQTLKFNSGADTEAVFGIGYGSAINAGTLWLDDLCLVEADKPDVVGVQNGNFENGLSDWEGSASTYKIGGKNSATLTNRSQFLKQSIAVEPYTDYTIKVTAKTSEAGALCFGAANSGANALTAMTALSHNSYMTTNGTGVMTYSVDFNSGLENDVNIFLQSVCDSKVSIFSVEVTPADKLITYDTIDFEDGKTLINGGITPYYETIKTNNLWYELTSSQAHSGDYALRMKATSTDNDPKSNLTTDAGETLKHPLYQDWTCFTVNPGEWYTLSYYVKAAKAGVSYDSSIRALDASVWDYAKSIDKKTVTLSDTEWTLVEHTFASNYVDNGRRYVHFVLSANDGTNGDLFFDDITLKRTNAIASEVVEKPFTEPLYNLITDGSFEDGSAAYGGNIVTAADAFDGTHFLRVNEGEKLIVPIKTRVDYNFKSSLYYTLSGAIRASSGGAGYVAISATADGNAPVLYADGTTAAIASNGTAWSFDAFKYISPDVRPTYLVIECSKGYIDVDSLQFFSEFHAYAERPDTNVPTYNYDNLSGAIANGGTAISGAVSLTVSNTVANKNYSGISGTVYFPIIDDVMGRDMTEEQLREELTRFKNAGIKRLRTMFRSHWAYTGDPENPWDWNSSQMQQFYDWCKLVEEYDMEVMILAGWHLSSYVYGASSIPDVEYLSPRLTDANGNVQYAISWGIFHPAIDMDLASERYATWMTEAILAIRNHGVTNMTHVLTFNEPSHQNVSIYLYQGAHASQMVQLVDTLVDKLKATYTDSTKKQTVRDSIILVGPNQSGPSEHAGLAEYFVKNSKYGYGLYDIWTTHLTEGTTDRDNPGQDAPMVGPAGDVYDQFLNTYYSSWLNNLKAIDSRFANATFWCDEFAVSGHALIRNENYSDLDQRWWGVKSAGQLAALMNAGLSGGILWQFADCLWSYISGSGGEFLYGNHMGGATTSLIQTQTPYYIYYSTSLLTKYMSGSGGATTYVSNSNNAHVHISTVKMADGNWSILVVNNNETAQNISVNIAPGIGGKTMYRHVYEAATVEPTSAAAVIPADKTYTNITNKINDTIPAGSVVVYTTIKG